MVCVSYGFVLVQVQVHFILLQLKILDRMALGTPARYKPRGWGWIRKDAAFSEELRYRGGGAKR
jgi:hypothetical protein